MAIEREDLVLISHGGRLFHARVLGRELGGRYRIEPLDRRVRDRSAALVEIAGHWACQGDPRPRSASGQQSFDHLLGR